MKLKKLLSIGLSFVTIVSSNIAVFANEVSISSDVKVTVADNYNISVTSDNIQLSEKIELVLEDVELDEIKLEVSYEELSPFIVSDIRAFDSIYISSYSVTFDGIRPADMVTVSTVYDGVRYAGKLDLDSYTSLGDNKYIGYYSGYLYPDNLVIHQDRSQSKQFLNSPRDVNF